MAERLSELDFYVQRADQCRAEADAALLDNIRAQCLSAEQVWLGMAERARRSAELKKDR